MMKKSVTSSLTLFAAAVGFSFSVGACTMTEYLNGTCNMNGGGKTIGDDPIIACRVPPGTYETCPDSRKPCTGSIVYLSEPGIIWTTAQSCTDQGGIIPEAS